MTRITTFSQNHPLGLGAELESASGMRIRCLAFGATLASVWAPDRNGRSSDLVLGFDSLEDYRKHKDHYFGATIGRVANRIDRGRFRIGNKLIELSKNSGEHHLHGGSTSSFDRVNWLMEISRDPNNPYVEFNHNSRSGSEGYPGSVSVKVRYTLSEDMTICIRYEAYTDEDTPLSLTNHTYWNLKGAGVGDTNEHRVQLGSKTVTKYNSGLIPSGEIERLTKTSALYFATSKSIESAHILQKESGVPIGIDQNFIVDSNEKNVARITELCTGRILTISSSLPCFQFYNGIHLNGLSGKRGKRYPQFGGIAIEPQRHPDAVNHPNFPSSIVHPGDLYQEDIKFHLSTT